jgi:hypothetical protein
VDAVEAAVEGVAVLAGAAAMVDAAAVVGDD